MFKAHVSVLVALATPSMAQTDWTQLTPTTSPPAFTAHAMAYFPPADQTVLFGGVANSVRAAETWLWDGTNWSQANPPVSPPARVAHAMAFDPNRGRLVMFGGIPATGGLLGDTWEWDGGNWQQMSPVNSPPPRRSHPMAFLPSRGTVILWGGYDTGDRNDTWEWNGVNWTQLATANSPAPRRASDMAWDPMGGGLVLFSGYLMGADTWRFDGTNWTQLTPATSPPARYDHSMVTDDARGRIVMFGGLLAADTWEWTGSDWLQRTPATLPNGRFDTYLAYDSLRREVLMFGSSTSPETWRYRPNRPARFVTSGTGCGGNFGAPPLLSSNGLPWLGEVFSVVTAPVPSNTVAAMLLGGSDTVSALGPLPIPLAALGMTGCSLQVDPVLNQTFAAAGTTATWNLAIPANPSLVTVRLFNQAAVVAPGANMFGLLMSDHGQIVIGGK